MLNLFLSKWILCNGINVCFFRKYKCRFFNINSFPTSIHLFYYLSFSFLPYEATWLTVILVGNIRGFANFPPFFFVSMGDALWVISKVFQFVYSAIQHYSFKNSANIDCHWFFALTAPCWGNKNFVFSR